MTELKPPSTSNEPLAVGDDLSLEEDYIEKRSKSYRWLIKTYRATSWVLITGVFVTVMLQVITRYVLKSPLSWTEESARLLLVWLTFTAAGYVSSRRAHISVDIITTVLPKKLSEAIGVFADIMSIASSIIMLIAGIMLVKIVMPVTLPATGLPTYLLYSAAVVGFAIMLVHTAIGLYLGLFHKDESLDSDSPAGKLEGI
ncbi:TRAP transporter small permease [Brevibacterium ravenspurgense]|uniref:TRAP transporter small permease n=1 Tax=Brevibacterium ravenspurgense TaxID=479117 RepID=UPI0002D69931|nr:TRAP transporter small permease [Brevibacterium ravenspurgense]